jgi:hypothetical protein
MTAEREGTAMMAVVDMGGSCGSDGWDGMRAMGRA